jgi:hypothetical protein
MFKLAVPAMAAALFVSTTFAATPAAAQRASDCGQLAEADGKTFTYVQQNSGDSAAVMAGVVNAAIQNVQAAVPVTLSDLAANVSVVCVSDSLNNNHLEILKNIDVDVIKDITIGDVNVLAIDTINNKVYVAPADLTFGS